MSVLILSVLSLLGLVLVLSHRIQLFLLDSLVDMVLTICTFSFGPLIILSLDAMIGLFPFKAFLKISSRSDAECSGYLILVVSVGLYWSSLFVRFDRVLVSEKLPFFDLKHQSGPPGPNASPTVSSPAPSGDPANQPPNAAGGNKPGGERTQSYDHVLYLHAQVNLGPMDQLQDHRQPMGLEGLIGPLPMRPLSRRCLMKIRA